MLKNIKNFLIISSFLVIALIKSEKKALLKQQPKAAVAPTTAVPTTAVPTAPATSTAASAPAKRDTNTNGAIVTPPQNNDPSNIDYTMAKNINCSESNCRIPNMCSSDKKTCMCSLDYAEYLLNKPLEQGEQRVDASKMTLFCAHARKNQLTYFLLEFFLNIGAGHFYAGNTGLGVAKIIVVLLPCIAMCILGCMGAMSGLDKGMAFGTGIAICASCAISIWWLVDIIMIAVGKKTDGLGVPLKHW